MKRCDVCKRTNIDTKINIDFVVEPHGAFNNKFFLCNQCSEEVIDSIHAKITEMRQEIKDNIKANKINKRLKEKSEIHLDNKLCPICNKATTWDIYVQSPECSMLGEYCLHCKIHRTHTSTPCGTEISNWEIKQEN